MLYVLVPVLLVFFNTSRRVVMWKKKPEKKNYMHASMRFELGPFSIAHAPLYRYTYGTPFETKLACCGRSPKRRFLVRISIV